MWPVIEIRGGSSSVTPKDQQTQDVHGVHSGSQDPPAACVVCGKQFPNKKSLGGHMSMHPERPWRGLYAPQTGQSYASLARTGRTTSLACLQIDRQETKNSTIGHVIEIGGGSSSITSPRDQQTQDVHGGSQDPPAAYAPETGQSSVSSTRDGGTTALASMQIDLNQPALEE
jgi:hypothetical protein